MRDKGWRNFGNKLTDLLMQSILENTGVEACRAIQAALKTSIPPARY